MSSIIKTYLFLLISFGGLSQITQGCTEMREDFEGGSSAMTIRGDHSFEGGNLVLKLTQEEGKLNGVGSQATTNEYFQYGRINARLRTAGTNGVVSAMFTMADNKDEIDLEWLGGNSRELLSNYFYQGELVYTNNGTHVGADSSKEFVVYSLDWKEDSLSWLINNRVVRTLKKSDTLDRKTGVYKYPSNPTRIHFSIWDGGDSTEDGTSEWAGGPVPWNDPAIHDDGRLDMKIDYLEVKCTPSLRRRTLRS
ncbi:putative glycosidase CRH2 [Basidiobolus ranarum]|uniref:Glycosidase CRH2 n=1 Tax=Basidiobolus ranarum TaxID=34480 RepID=A0ABR2WUB9_9FUNG